MAIQKLRRFLDENLVEYVVITHSQAYTSQGSAEEAQIPGNELVKTVMLEKVDGELCMVVLPASKEVSLAAFAKNTNSGSIYHATARDLKDRFPNCEVGALPPFGNLYGVPVYADTSLADDKEIAFSAGSHLQLVQLAFSDFQRLVGPTIVDLAVPRSTN
jgi:Ala-tRNA(Pro) deacylase